VRACAEKGEARAWEEFIRRFNKLLATVVMRTARRWGEATPQVVDDLIQEAYLKFCADRCRLLREFRPQHPDAIYGFLKVVAANVVHDHFKAQRASKRGASEALPLREEIEPGARNGSSGSSEAIERGILLAQVDDVLLRRVPEPGRGRQRMIFWLYYRDGLTTRAIAALPFVELSTKGVESAIHRLTRLVRNELVERSSRMEIEPKGEKGLRFPDSL
jgi:RNA polymerase sigma-70 factor (ECF subfamily)